MFESCEFSTNRSESKKKNGVFKIEDSTAQDTQYPSSRKESKVSLEEIWDSWAPQFDFSLACLPLHVHITSRETATLNTSAEADADRLFSRLTHTP